jgi:hypothetical protein
MPENSEAFTLTAFALFENTFKKHISGLNRLINLIVAMI